MTTGEPLLRFSYELTEEFVNEAWRRYVGVRLGWRLPLVLALFIILIATFTRFGGPPQLLATIAIVGLGIALIVFATISRRGKITNALLGKIESRLVTWRLFDDRFESMSALGFTAAAWSDVMRLVRRDGVWLMFFSKHRHIPLPPAAMSAEVREFIVDRVAAAGGRVI